ncbi:MAG TPA: zinc ribbon domain-containing protein [Gemmatimonadaceae bacterium]|jgi:putative FmdB family regulatory protein
MPTYEYRCPDGHDFEKFVQKISLASAELPCPVCGKPADRRISVGGGFVFKGSGFYITDYGKDGKKDLRANAAAASAKDNDASAKKSEGSSSGDSTSKSESGASSGSGGKGDSSKSDDSKGDASTRESSRSDTPKGESSKNDALKSDRPKSDRPAAAPSAPKSPGSDK